MKVIPIIVIGILLTGAFTSSCRHYPTAPNDSTKCDTCCDTCHTDSTHHPPCDTCNKSDTTSHDFQWTEYTIPQESNLTGAWVFDSTHILICGDRLWDFDGNGFTPHDARNATHNVELNEGLSGVTIFAFSQNDIWLTHGSITFHCKDGKNFEDIRPGSSNYTWGTSSNDIFVVGNNGQIHHGDGNKFTDMVSGTTKNLRSVWGTSHNDVWACGYNSSNGETVLLHYDGVSWTEDPISVTKGIYATGGFNGVWACDSAGHKFVSTSGALLIRKTGEGNWRSDSGLVPNSLGGGSWVGISPMGNAANDFFVTGGWGFIAHWNGKDWHKYESLYDYNNAVYGPAEFSVKGNTACVVGIKSGQSWIAVGRRK
jgi:hypothetical protein